MERTWKPKAAGILCITAGVLCLPISIVVNLVLDLAMLVVTGEPGGSGEFPVAFAVTMWILPLILAIAAIVGGINALRRRRWGLALAGSICVIIPGIGFGGIGALLCASALSSSSLAILAFVIIASLALPPPHICHLGEAGIQVKSRIALLAVIAVFGVLRLTALNYILV